MELVLKLPEGKPPFIGLLFNESKAALSQLEYLLHYAPDVPVSLKIHLDQREPRITILHNYEESLCLKFRTNQFLAVKEFRKFERAPSVNFGAVIRNVKGEHQTVWSEKHQRWVCTKVSNTAFYFRNYL